MAEAITPPASRSAACPCGSGRRYKNCHGALAAVLPDVAPDAHQLALQGLEAQQQQNLPLAKQRYEQALRLSPNHADALHMLGVIHYELDEPKEAAAHILRALDLTDWQSPSFRHNLGLVLAKLAERHTGSGPEYGVSAKGQRYRAQLASRRPSSAAPINRIDTPLVSVVVPSFNHAQYLERALESVYAQTYRNIELIVIDDGSTDGSADIARASLATCPFAHRLIVRENRGAGATLNEAVGLASGHYINPLNSDDLFAPQRIERLVSAAASSESALIFSATQFIDANGQSIDAFADERVYSLLCRQANINYVETVGHAFLVNNIAVTTGNLFFRRTLFDTLGGFRDFRYNHDWDFCLRALWLVEPLFVDEPLYHYRFHGTNTISESAEKNRVEAIRIHTAYLAQAFDRSQIGCEYTPNLHQWGHRFVVEVLGNGLTAAVSPEFLKRYAKSLLETSAASATPP